VRAQRHLGLLLEPSDDVDGVTAHDGRVWPVEGPSSVVDTTIAGMFTIRVTHGSRRRGFDVEPLPRLVGVPVIWLPRIVWEDAVALAMAFLPRIRLLLDLTASWCRWID
jgi:hypothetical protein